MKKKIFKIRTLKEFQATINEIAEAMSDEELTFAEEDELEQLATEKIVERANLLDKRIAEALASVPGAADWEKVDVLTDALLVFAVAFEGDPLMTAKQKLARHFIDKAKWSYPSDNPKI